jgi:hypothetical protein
MLDDLPDTLHVMREDAVICTSNNMITFIAVDIAHWAAVLPVTDPNLLEGLNRDGNSVPA